MIEKQIHQLQAELVEVEYRHENGDLFLRIFIDRETGVDLDLCTGVSRHVKEIIDSAGIEYDHLEVSSPGMNRKLRNDADFCRFNGKTVKVNMTKKYEGPRQVVGVLVGYDEQTLKVEKESGVLELPRSEITVVRLHPDW